MSLVALRLRKHPLRSETTPAPIHSLFLWPCSAEAEEQAQVLRNASLTHRSNIGSHLLTTYYVPETVLGFTFHIAGYLLFTAEEIKAQRG